MQRIQVASLITTVVLMANLGVAQEQLLDEPRRIEQITFSPPKSASIRLTNGRTALTCYGKDTACGGFCQMSFLDGRCWQWRGCIPGWGYEAPLSARSPAPRRDCGAGG